MSRVGCVAYLKSQICYESCLQTSLQYARLSIYLHTLQYATMTLNAIIKGDYVVFCVDCYFLGHPHSVEIDVYKI
jgi:hypothetical protein